MMDAAAESIVVTGSRMKAVMPNAVVVAEQENLGDLKLYRVPEPVTVNAKGQKQVAMLVKPRADFDVYYSAEISAYDNFESSPMNVMLRGENLKDKGLGSPMPSGQVLIFEDSSHGPLLTGQTSLTDKALGQRRITAALNLRDPKRALQTAIAPLGGRLQDNVPYTLIVSSKP